MSSFPQVNIDFSLVLLLRLLCGRCVLWNNIIRFSAAVQIFVSFVVSFRAISYSVFFYTTFEEQTKLQLDFGGKNETGIVDVFTADTGSLFQQFSIHDCAFYNWAETKFSNLSEPKFRTLAVSDRLMPAV